MHVTEIHNINFKHDMCESLYFGQIMFGHVQIGYSYKFRHTIFLKFEYVGQYGEIYTQVQKTYQLSNKKKIQVFGDLLVFYWKVDTFYCGFRCVIKLPWTYKKITEFVCLNLYEKYCFVRKTRKSESDKNSPTEINHIRSRNEKIESKAEYHIFISWFFLIFLKSNFNDFQHSL